MLERSVGEKCCREVLEKSVGEESGREVLEKSVAERNQSTVFLLTYSPPGAENTWKEEVGRNSFKSISNLAD